MPRNRFFVGLVNALICAVGFYARHRRDPVADHRGACLVTDIDRSV